MTGRIHSLQSLGAVDGPGLRYVVFLQGCPLRCAYCHNPDTWDFDGGTEWEASRLVEEILKYRVYFGSRGGVTFSGGEPLAQADFTAECFALLQEKGIHTALDTSGAGNLKKSRRVLEHTDLILGDIKFITPEDYDTYCKGSYEEIQKFFRMAEEMKVPLWVRHVVVPDINDDYSDLERFHREAHKYSNLEKIEWLPFHNLCVEKYEALGIEFPLQNHKPMDPAVLEKLTRGL